MKYIQEKGFSITLVKINFKKIFRTFCEEIKDFYGNKMPDM